jgi:menaquinol-cytochrome c reductase iron-sulfur subunit
MTGGAAPEPADRRTFLARLAGGVAALATLVVSWPLVRSLLPNVLYEPPRRFKVGLPETFQEGVVFLDERRIFLFREGGRFHAMSGVCTHLGCTVKYSAFGSPTEKTVRGHTFKAAGEFICPCHGSKFHGEGTNFAGPAPRPLQSYHVELSAADGQLVVDLAREVDREFRLVV